MVLQCVYIYIYKFSAWSHLKLKLCMYLIEIAINLGVLLAGNQFFMIVQFILLLYQLIKFDLTYVVS